MPGSVRCSVNTSWILPIQREGTEAGVNRNSLHIVLIGTADTVYVQYM
jgi:hypothetical protein